MTLSVSSPSQHRSTRSLCSLAQNALWGCALSLQEVLSLWMCFSLLEKICFHPPQSGRTTLLQQYSNARVMESHVIPLFVLMFAGKKEIPHWTISLWKRVSSHLLFHAIFEIWRMFHHHYPVNFLMAILSSPLLFQQHTMFNSNSSLLHSFPLTSSSF